MENERWFVAQPGGPEGPFWSIISGSGRVIAARVADRETAREIVALRSERDDIAAKLKTAYAELHDLRIRAGLNR